MTAPITGFEHVQRPLQGFGGEIHLATRVIRQSVEDAFERVARMALDSVVNGSAITGAPGQPVRTGRLKKSWRLRMLTARRFRIASNAPHAHLIEDNVQNAKTFHQGGPHSVKLTIASIDRLIAAAAVDFDRLSL